MPLLLKHSETLVFAVPRDIGEPIHAIGEVTFYEKDNKDFTSIYGMIGDIAVLYLDYEKRVFNRNNAIQIQNVVVFDEYRKKGLVSELYCFLAKNVILLSDSVQSYCGFALWDKIRRKTGKVKPINIRTGKVLQFEKRRDIIRHIDKSVWGDDKKDIVLMLDLQGDTEPLYNSFEL